ncbi:MAG: hypothetical protein ACOY4K_02675 [Pseudomonadota bacterium]
MRRDLSDIESAAGRPAAAERAAGPRFAARLSGASGRPLQVEGVLRPVIALGEGGARGRAVAATVREPQAGGRPVVRPPEALNPVDLERIDLSVVEKAFEAMEPGEPGQRPPILFLPLSWSTVRNAAARRRVLRLAAAGQVARRVIALCEIVGLEPGAPPSAVRETTGRLQPIFRGVLVRAGLDRRPLAGLQSCGFTGVSIAAADLDGAGGGPDVLRRVLALQAIGPGVLVHAVRSVAGLAAARSAGASWASLDIVPGARDGAGLAAHAKAAAGEPPTAAASPAIAAEV